MNNNTSTRITPLRESESGYSKTPVRNGESSRQSCRRNTVALMVLSVLVVFGQYQRAQRSRKIIGEKIMLEFSLINDIVTKRGS